MMKMSKLSQYAITEAVEPFKLHPTSMSYIYYRIDRAIRTTSRQISFEFLFIKTRPPDKLDNGFRRGIERRNQIRYVICQGGEF